MARNPKVSICIPSYNHARFLPAAIESALGQTYKQIEIIIVDDGSTDGSLQIAESYAARYPALIKVYTHPEQRNLGVAATANLAHQQASGEYWSGLCSDDVLYPDKLARQVAFLEAHPEIGWVYSYAHYIDEHGDKRHERGLFGLDITRAPEPLERLIEGNVIPAMTILARRSCLAQAGWEDESLLYSDWEFWVRLLAHWPVAFLHRPLVQYRVHGANASVDITPDVNMRRGLEVLTALRRKAATVGGALARPRTLALLELQLAYHLYFIQDEGPAVAHLGAAYVVDPALRTDVAYLVRWLKARFRELTLLPVEYMQARAFVDWTLAHLPAQVDESYRRALAKTISGRHFSKAAAAYHRAGTLLADRRKVLGCLGKDPHVWRDRALLAEHAQALAGARIRRQAQRLLRRRQGRKDVSALKPAG